MAETPANPERIAMATAMAMHAALASHRVASMVTMPTAQPSASSVSADHCRFESSFCRKSRYRIPVDTMFRFFRIVNT